MKWFRHDVPVRRDDKTWELIDRHSLEGYAIWMIVLEDLHQAARKNCQVVVNDLWVKQTSKTFKIEDGVLASVLNTLAELDLISADRWAEKVLFSQTVKDYCDLQYRYSGYRKHQSVVFNRDGYQCVYCKAIENLTLDHVIPQSRGGSHESDNLVCACASCNSRKRNRTPEEWLGGMSWNG